MRFDWPIAADPRSRWNLLVLLVPLVISGCGGRSSSPVSPTVLPTVAPTHSANPGPIATLRAGGFTPDYHIDVSVTGDVRITVVHAVCTGSADGHCQEVEAFDATGHMVWRRHYVDVIRLLAVPNGFTVRSAKYLPNDPLCCPSGGISTARFTWDGKGFVLVPSKPPTSMP